MSDDKNQDEKSDGEKKQGGSKKTLLMAIIAGVVVLAVLGLGIFVGSKFLAPSAQPAAAHDEAAKGKEHKDDHGTKKKDHAEEEEEVDEKEVGMIISVPDMILNPKNSSTRYVVVAFGLEIDKEKGEEAKEKVGKELMIPIQSVIQKRISSYTIEELQNPGIKDSLPVVLRKDLRPYLSEFKLKNVYMPKFIIQ
jgi:flagellar basal body-associated protein FliL